MILPPKRILLPGDFDPRTYRAPRRRRQLGFITPALLGVVAKRRGGVDPSFSSVILLLHGDGTNGQTTTIDSSSYASTVTLSGTCVLSSTQAKFGPTSISYPSGVGSCTTTSYNNPAQQFGSSDLSFEFFFFKPTAQAGTFKQWFDIRNNSGNGTISLLFGDLVAADSMSCWLQFNGATWGLKLDRKNYTTNAWHYCSLTRSGNSWSFNVDASGSPITGTLSGSIDTAITSSGSINVFDGIPGSFIDEVRLTKGVVRNVSAVPTAAFGDS